MQSSIYQPVRQSLFFCSRVHFARPEDSTEPALQQSKNDSASLTYQSEEISNLTESRDMSPGIFCIHCQFNITSCFGLIPIPVMEYLVRPSTGIGL